MELIDKADLVVRVEMLQSKIAEEKKLHEDVSMWYNGINHGFNLTKKILNDLEVKKVDLIIHTIIAECCDWLAMNTNLSQDEIESCRNLILTVKEEQLKAWKGK